MTDVWRAFSGGLEIGDNLGGQIRNANAFREGGLDAVAEAAGRVGDLQTMEGARGMVRRQRQFEDDERQNAYERMEQIRPLAVGALNRVGKLPFEQRAEWLNLPHIRQRFIDWGIQPEQFDAGVAMVSNPETGDAALEALLAAFTQHQNPDWQLVGRTYVAPSPDGQPLIGGSLPESVATNEWRAATPEEAATLPPGTEWDINVRTGERRLRYRPNAPRAGNPNGYFPDDGYDYEAD